MAYTVVDRRGTNNSEAGFSYPCRTCGCSEEMHTDQYNNPTMKCLTYLREKISKLEKENASLKAENREKNEKYSEKS